MNTSSYEESKKQNYIVNECFDIFELFFFLEIIQKLFNVLTNKDLYTLCTYGSH